MNLESRIEPIKSEDLSDISAGAGKQEKYVSAFYCEICKKTIHLNMIYSLDRARKEHNARFHPYVN